MALACQTQSNLITQYNHIKPQGQDFSLILCTKTLPKQLVRLGSVSSHLTLMIMLGVAVFLLPVIVAYTAWAYKVMAGKVTDAYIKENQKTLSGQSHYKTLPNSSCSK